MSCFHEFYDKADKTNALYNMRRTCRSWTNARWVQYSSYLKRSYNTSALLVACSCVTSKCPLVCNTQFLDGRSQSVSRQVLILEMSVGVSGTLAATRRAASSLTRSRCDVTTCCRRWIWDCSSRLRRSVCSSFVDVLMSASLISRDDWCCASMLRRSPAVQNALTITIIIGITLVLQFYFYAPCHLYLYHFKHSWLHQ